MKFIIFDIDGTLSNTKNVDDKCFIKAFEQTFQIDIRDQIWEDLKNVTDWGITDEIVKREWKREPRKYEYELIISNLIANLEKEKAKDGAQFKEIFGATAFFRELQQMENYKLGIATGAWEKSAKLKLDSIGIELNNISFSNSNYHKSREEITKDVIHQLKKTTNKPPERILYFGDGIWDYKSCQNIGIEFIGIDYEGNGKLRQIGAKTIYRDYSHCDQILGALEMM